MSLFEIADTADPGCPTNCMGECTGPELIGGIGASNGAETGVKLGAAFGTGAEVGTGAAVERGAGAGPAGGSGRGRGRMCFNRLFL